MNPQVLFSLLGKPKADEVEAKVREYNALYLATSDEEEKSVLLDTCRTLCEVQAGQEESAEVDAAKTSVSRAAKELSALKASLREGEYVTCEMRNNRSTVKWETVTPAGERHPWESPSTISTNLSQEMVQRIANGDKAAIKEIKKRAKETVERTGRLAELRLLCDTVARMVAEGTELVVTKAKATIVAETRDIRSEMRARVKLIEAGHKTANIGDKVTVDGKEFACFTAFE
jgi:hypothetical protein